MTTTNEPAEPETIEREPEPTALVATTIEEISALRDPIGNVQARGVILETARRLAIRMTAPEDWVLFKSPDDRITAYLQDAGADRVRDILGIEVFDIGKPERISSGDEAGSFMYLITGSGRSRLTLQTVETMEGGRSSTDDFCKGKQGAELELLVRKAARANLDGNITRELAGLKSVPIGDLSAAWDGTQKKTEHCRRGRGFGTQSERLGATREADPDVEPPTCPVCPPVNGAPVRLKYRAAKGDRKAFYGCPNFEKHGNRRVIVDAAEWIAKASKPAPAAAPSSEREPGSEG